MADTAVLSPVATGSQGKIGLGIFLAVLVVGLAYVGVQLTDALAPVREASYFPYILLGVALLIALGFEFVNGFHDTANAVATVIYTHALPANFAVVWSGFFNFLGVLTSTGLVAFGIVSLLPVELILKVGSAAGFAMVFALLIAAILWNLGTWYFGLPNSSSHTLIGSIIGVGLTNQLLSGPSGTSGVDWSQATNIIKALLFSPLVGFVLSGLLLLLSKALIKVPALYQAPHGKKAPPFYIRALLILTCTGVSFAHGSNDGQKGMGLIMLILIGTVPTAFALNRTVNHNDTVAFVAVAQQASGAIDKYKAPDAPASKDPHAEIEDYVRTRTVAPVTVPALAALTSNIADQVKQYDTLAAIPPDTVRNVRNDMYLSSEALRLLGKDKSFKPSAEDGKIVADYTKRLNNGIKFIPTWVKVAVALALGLGTMVGWKRIVVTVGEKIGKDHLTYAQGASAELVAMGTIMAADVYGLPVSTTHVLSSGVAGTMAANGSGLQMETVRNLLLAWVLTLPASILISGFLFWLFRSVM